MYFTKEQSKGVRGVETLLVTATPQHKVKVEVISDILM